MVVKPYCLYESIITRSYEFLVLVTRPINFEDIEFDLTFLTGWSLQDKVDVEYIQSHADTK